MKTKRSLQPIVFDMASDQCVWAKAGVIKPTACINAFNCLNCPLDRKMQVQVKKQQLGQGPGRHIAPEIKTTLKRSAMDQQCRHMLSGRIISKTCPHDFDCPTCSFQQLMENENMNAVSHPVPKTAVHGFEMADQYYYHRRHIWARVEYGGRVRIGLDDFAARLMGELDQVQLPDLGQHIQSNEIVFKAKRQEFSAMLVTPVSGIVISKNPVVKKQPKCTNQSPYEDGWLIVIEPLRLTPDLKKMHFGSDSITWMEDEVSRLSNTLSRQSEYKMAATGGRAVSDIFSHLPKETWDDLAKQFL